MSDSKTSTASCEFGFADESIHAQIYESQLLKAGLRGEYRHAETELGEKLCALVESGRGAYLFGKPGRGKTFSAAHAVRRFTASHMGLGGRRNKAWLVTAKRLLDDIKADMNEHSSNTVERAEEVGLLVIDDFGAERLTDWAIETLTRIIDSRTTSGLPTILTSNYPLGQLRDIWGEIPGARMASRIGGACEVFPEITGEDRRLS